MRGGIHTTRSNAGIAVQGRPDRPPGDGGGDWRREAPGGVPSVVSAGGARSAADGREIDGKGNGTSTAKWDGGCPGRRAGRRGAGKEFGWRVRGDIGGTDKMGERTGRLVLFFLVKLGILRVDGRPTGRGRRKDQPGAGRDEGEIPVKDVSVDVGLRYLRGHDRRREGTHRQREAREDAEPAACPDRRPHYPSLPVIMRQNSTISTRNRPSRQGRVSWRRGYG